MYDFIFGDRDPVAEPGLPNGTSGDWWTTAALVPDLLQHSVDGFIFYRNPARELPPDLRELAQTRIGWARQSRFVFSQHCKASRDNGVAEEKIQAIPSWSTSDVFSPVERAVLAWTDFLAVMSRALRLELDDRDEPLTEVTGPGISRSLRPDAPVE